MDKTTYQKATYYTFKNSILNIIFVLLGNLALRKCAKSVGLLPVPLLESPPSQEHRRRRLFRNLVSQLSSKKKSSA